MADDLSHLKKKRGGLRAYVTTCLAKNPEESQAPEADIQSLSKHAQSLSEQDEVIQNLIEDETELVNDIQTSCQIQDQVDQFKCKLSMKIKQEVVSEAHFGSGREGSIAGSVRGKSFTKLQKLELPKFSGDPMEWTTFWQQFNDSVHENDDLSGVQKFSYLNMCLKGTATSIIQGLAITSENYKHATELLMEKYGQKEIIVNAHIEALLEIPKNSDASKLRCTFDSIERHIRGLEALGVPPDQYSLVVAPLILQKIPPEIRLVLSREHGDDVWNLSKLRECLKNEVRARERTQIPDKKGRAGSGPTSTNLNPSDMPKKGADDPPKCVFCDGSHRPGQCALSANERLSAVRDKRLCYGCLRSGHSIKRCTFRYKCKIGGKYHHKALCDAHHDKNQKAPDTNSPSKPDDKQSASKTDPTSNAGTDSGSPVKTNSHLVVCENKSVLLKTAIVPVSTESTQAVRANVVFDDASQLSYVTEALVQKLQGRKTESIQLSIAHFQSTGRSHDQYDVTKLILHCRDGSKVTVEVVIVPNIAPPVYRQTISTEGCADLGLLDLADPGALMDDDFGIDVLIGAVHYYDFVEGGLQRFPNGVVATESSVGWLLTGPALVDSAVPTSSGGHTLFVNATAGTLDRQLNRLWDLDSMGIQAETDSLGTDSDLLTDFNRSIEFSAGRYQVKLPWISEQASVLPDNRGLALKRFRALQRKMRRHPELSDPYRAYFDTKIAKGYVERVPDENVKQGVVHYLPHHAVLKPDSRTTKVRPVFDASARLHSESPSLNDSLHEGPNMTGDIFHIMVQFRSRAVGLTSDIEKAFFQVGLLPTDRDCTRFFWCESFYSYQLEVYRFTRVPFGLNCSPFLLNATVRYHLAKSSSSLAQQATDAIYVDNIILSVHSVDEASKFYKEGKRVFAEAGMNLREWACNSAEFMATVSDKDRVDDNEVRVLGMSWDRESDMLHVRPPRNFACNPETKRYALRVISSVYDPLGFLVPIYTPGRVFMQQLWRNNVGWDEPIPDPLMDEWHKIYQQITEIGPTVLIPRFLGVTAHSSQQLHVFADASPLAYAASAYLRVESNATITTNLICSKAKVAPVKRQLTLPKLELMAIVIAKRLAASVFRSLKCSIADIYIWSDSKIALSWVTSKLRLKDVFVRNRVTEINGIDAKFRYVPSKDNPADIATRYVSLADLKSSVLWWKGPSWLIQQEFPPEPSQKLPIKDEPVVLHTAVDIQRLGVIDFQRYSCLQKLYRVIGYCILFCDKLKKDSRGDGCIPDAEHLARAKVRIERHVQETAFAAEIETLKRKNPNKFARDLGLFIDKEGLLRCRGRLEFSDLPMGAVFPKLLPRDHPYTRLIIRHVHSLLCHQGTAHTMGKIREEYWIPKGKQQVKKALRQCVVCRKWEGRPYPGVDPAPLPTFRVTASPPFSYCGLDFAGPISCKEGKVWFCIFTCAATRAVHLELVSNMTTTEFLLAFRRFISRRTTPVKVVSDNAKTFKLADNVLDRLWTAIVMDEDVLTNVTSKGVKWQFNVERAPWWGGFFERMVGLVKRCLKKVMGCRKLYKVELETQLIEIEAILNSRPITYLSDDIGQLPLTPQQVYGTDNQSAPFPGVIVTPRDICGSVTGALPHPGPEGSASTDPDYIPNESSVQAVVKPCCSFPDDCAKC